MPRSQTSHHNPHFPITEGLGHFSTLTLRRPLPQASYQQAQQHRQPSFRLRNQPAGTTMAVPFVDQSNFLPISDVSSRPVIVNILVKTFGKGDLNHHTKIGALSLTTCHTIKLIKPNATNNLSPFFKSAFNALSDGVVRFAHCVAP